MNHTRWVIDEVMWSIRNDKDFKGQITLMELAIERAVRHCADIANQCGRTDIGDLIKQQFDYE